MKSFASLGGNGALGTAKEKREMKKLMRNIKWLAICAYAVAFVWEAEPEGGAE